MTVRVPVRVSIRFECPSRHTQPPEAAHDRGVSQPQRNKCRHCRSPLLIQRGYWGTFLARTDGHYPLADALSLHPYQVTAERRVAEDYRDLVVSWIEEV